MSLNLGKQIVVLIGPEGSGKTTVAKRLAAESQKPFITTGDIIRGLAVTDKTEVGDECRSMLKESRYLDPKLLIKILLGRLADPDTQEGFILDGGLRTLPETQNFPQLLEEANRILPLSVVYLQIPEVVTIERLTGEGARKRFDDTLEAIRKRLSAFNFQLEERLDFLKKQEGWRLLEVDATPSPEEVYKLVCKKLTT